MFALLNGAERRAARRQMRWRSALFAVERRNLKADLAAALSQTLRVADAKQARLEELEHFNLRSVDVAANRGVIRSSRRSLY